MEALQRLRECIVSDQKVQESGSDLSLNGKAYSKTLILPIKAKLPITLGGLWAFHQHIDEGYAVVRRVTREKNLGQPPSILLKNELMDYLQGRNSGDSLLTEEGKAERDGVARAKSSIADPLAVGAGGGAAAAAESAVDPLAPGVFGWQPLSATAMLEQPMRTRESVLSTPVNLFERLKDLIALGDSTNSEGARGTKRGRDDAGGHRTPFIGRPIIVVPSATSSLITLHNVKQFLENGAFVSSADAQAASARAGSGVKPERVIVQRTDNRGVPCSYVVVDDPSRLQLADWRRVSAVFALGPKWQIAGWDFGKPRPRPMGPADIFHPRRCRGYHLHYGDEAPHDNINKWPVLPVSLDKTKRHLDAVAADKFWRDFDAYVASRKPEVQTPNTV